MKYGCIPSLALALCASHLFVGCTHAAASTTNQPQNHSPSTVAFDPTDRSQYRYIYAVYCNGTVDKLDLVRRTKVSSFQISEHSGTPPAVAVLPSAGMRPGTCLARAVVTADTHDQAAGVVNIVASDQLQPDEDGQAHFRLLTFALPAWTLQHTRDLGRFNVLNGTPPRMTRIADGSLAVRQVSSANPATEIANQVKTYIGTETLGWLTATEWSASNVLLDYALPDQTGTGIALANQAHRRVIRMAEFHKSTPVPERRLAPGGNFVLLTMQHFTPVGKNLRKIKATGELRLYDADRHRVATLTAPQIGSLASKRSAAGDHRGLNSEGNWFNIALTPEGLAVYTNRRGDYRFAPLGRTFDVAAVVDASTDDLDGARPSVVYAGQ